MRWPYVAALRKASPEIKASVWQVGMGSDQRGHVSVLYSQRVSYQISYLTTSLMSFCLPAKKTDWKCQSASAEILTIYSHPRETGKKTKTNPSRFFSPSPNVRPYLFL